MSGRQCRTYVISGTRNAIKSTLKRTLPEDLRAALYELRRRIGASGTPQDDVLGWAPDRWEPVRLEIRTGEYDRANAGLLRSVEILESQPWLPASARSITESVLQAIGRRPVDALMDRLPESDALAWESICGWVRCKRRDYPGRLRMARRAWELLTGSWPWGSCWVETQRPMADWVGARTSVSPWASRSLSETQRSAADWVGARLVREPDVMLDYAPLNDCTCHACVSRREEIENADSKFHLADYLAKLTERVARIEGTLSGS